MLLEGEKALNTKKKQLRCCRHLRGIKATAGKKSEKELKDIQSGKYT